MIDVYTWPTPNGHKVHIMLEECGLRLGRDWQAHPINIGAGDQFQPDFLTISPNNKIPALVDPVGPDGKPQALFESGAILIYLAAKFGRFMPRSDREKFEVLQWLMFQMGGVGPMLGQAHHFRRYAPKKNPLRHRALHQRGQTPLWRDGPPITDQPLAGRQAIQHCRYRRFPMVTKLGAPRHRLDRLPGTEILV